MVTGWQCPAHCTGSLLSTIGPGRGGSGAWCLVGYDTCIDMFHVDVPSSCNHGFSHTACLLRLTIGQKDHMQAGDWSDHRWSLLC